MAPLTVTHAVNDMTAYLYILRCADRSYYVGTTTGSLEQRLAEHQSAIFGGYTAVRRPVELLFHEHFERLEDAAAAERQIKGWRRDKKEALIRGNLAALPGLSRRGAKAAHPSTRRVAPAQDDGAG